MRWWRARRADAEEEPTPEPVDVDEEPESYGCVCGWCGGELRC